MSTVSNEDMRRGIDEQVAAQREHAIRQGKQPPSHEEERIKLVKNVERQERINKEQNR
jgi:hypothetical protein